MAVKYGRCDEDEELIQVGSPIARDGAAFLISSVDIDPEDPYPEMNEIWSNPGRVRLFNVHEDDDQQFIDQIYDQFDNAKLAFGLWAECGPFDEPQQDTAIPLEVATHGQPAIAAYLRVNGGYPKSRRSVAELMGIEPQTVSNYCGKITWRPPNHNSE